MFIRKKDTSSVGVGDQVFHADEIGVIAIPDHLGANFLKQGFEHVLDIEPKPNTSVKPRRNLTKVKAETND